MANVEEVQSAKSQLRCRARGMLCQWLTNSGGSLAISTYTSGKLVLLSSFDDRLHFRTYRFQRPMGIAWDGNKLALAVRRQVLLFQQQRTNKRALVLKQSYTTGKVDAHDVAFGKRKIYFANTRFNCIARPSAKKRFVHCWQPPFVEGLVYGDRCHLNGVGMHEGRPRMATAFCPTGHEGGWREQDRFTGGVMLDVESNEVVTSGLCMPHSPRWHDQRWWLCNSGHGQLLTVDSQSGEAEEVCALPGFTRGLCFVDDHALVGLSKIRRKHILDAPPVRQRHRRMRAGVALVNLQSGREVGSLEFLNGGNEVYEVVFLPKIAKPRLNLGK